MLLKDKVAVIYGGGGAIGGATARAFAREGARVFLAGRTEAKLKAVEADIRAIGGSVEVAVVDALDEAAVNAVADDVAKAAGGIDIMLNAVGVMHVQGVPLEQLSLAEFERPILGVARTNFITAKAVARHMVVRGKGVILTVTTPATRLSVKGVLGYGAACGALESLSRMLAAEVGDKGVRVVCLMPDALPDALPISYSRKVFEQPAAQMGTTPEVMLEEHGKSTLLGRSPRLAEVADYAAFIASDRASGTTAAILNITCGSVVD